MNVEHITPPPIQGVSQQPVSLRNPEQAQEQINAYPSLLSALRKRHPTQHLAALSSGLSAASNLATHPIDRSSGADYMAVFRAGGVSVLASNGDEVFVETPDGVGYLTTNGNDCKALSLADYTIVLNPNRTPAMDAAVTADLADDEAYIHVRRMQYDSEYTVRVSDGSVDESYTIKVYDGDASGAPGGSTRTPTIPFPASPAVLITQDTNIIAQQLVLGINAMNGGSPPWTASLMATNRGSVIKLTHNTTAFEEVEATSGQGDTLMTTLFQTVKREDELPLFCTHGFRLMVVGAENAEEDDHYVEFVADAGSGFGKGYWVESVGPGISYQLDASTMPHQLVGPKTDDGSGTVTGTPFATYFTFEQIDWSDREIGDDLSNPVPSFIGKRISSLFFFRNRLGFTADDKVILSESGVYFNFFRTTVKDLLDTAPIDVGMGTKRVSSILHAIPTERDLVLFTHHNQHILTGDPQLTPKTVQIIPILAHECSEYVEPQFVGRSTFFAASNESYTQLRELIRTGDLTFDAPEISIQVPRYVMGNPEIMAASSDAQMLVISATDDPSTLYVYKWLYVGNEKVQSAWFKYTFSGNVVGAEWFEDVLWLLIRRGGETCFEKMVVSENAMDPGGSSILTHLDRRIAEYSLSGGTFDGTNTTFDLPYDLDASLDYQCVTRKQGVSSEGGLITIVSIDDVSTPNKVVLSGNQLTAKFYFGESYRMEYTITPPVLKEESRSGRMSPLGSGTQIIQQGVIWYEDSKHFKVEIDFPVYSSQTSSWTYQFGPDALVALIPVSEVQSPQTGTYRFSVKARPLEVRLRVVNESFLPCTIGQISWTSLYRSKAKPMQG